MANDSRPRLITPTIGQKTRSPDLYVSSLFERSAFWIGPVRCVSRGVLCLGSWESGCRSRLPALRTKKRQGAEEGPAMLEVVISIPAIFLVILLALGCYMLGRNRGRAEAQQQFAPPAPPPGLSPK
ncbi:hypothetical protein HU200_032555 [Digitaria exilis]|uniref:Uncharacterized protein n=1 Tax=Digitaria exilis TaxID=1010633 RepID=A0A835BT36_9POAL|nr:hypothetical protein HU200_032555 [Digitaria exilis]